LTRASIIFERSFLKMDCRVKPGNDDQEWRQDGEVR
jgi:hypothetical protein